MLHGSRGDAEPRRGARAVLRGSASPRERRRWCLVPGAWFLVPGSWFLVPASCRSVLRYTSYVLRPTSHASSHLFQQRPLVRRQQVGAGEEADVVAGGGVDDREGVVGAGVHHAECVA